MARDEQQRTVIAQIRKIRRESRVERGIGFDSRDHLQERVDHCVARDDNFFVGDPLPQQVRARVLGRREMQIAESCGERSIRFFRPGRAQIAGAQTRLHMAYRNPSVKSGQSRRQSGRRIAVNEDPIRSQLGDDTLHAFENCDRDVGQRLPGAHQIEIDVGRDRKEVQHLIQHLSMLRGHADSCIDPGSVLQRLHQRRHLDRFGTGADDEQDGGEWFVLPGRRRHCYGALGGWGVSCKRSARSFSKSDGVSIVTIVQMVSLSIARSPWIRRLRTAHNRSPRNFSVRGAHSFRNVHCRLADQF